MQYGDAKHHENLSDFLQAITTGNSSPVLYMGFENDITLAVVVHDMVEAATTIRLSLQHGWPHVS